MAIRVGRWDCPVCGTKGNLGPETKCRNCGSARPQNVKFYLPEDSAIIEDHDKINEALAGVDWICGHCGAQNKAKDVLCESCGNPRDKFSGDIDLGVREYENQKIPRQGMRKEDESGEKYRREYQQIRTKPGYKRKKVRGILGAILSVPLLAVALYGLLRTFPATIDVEVVGFRWERTIQYEHYEPVQREAWSTPSDAFDIQPFRAVHHYDKRYVRTETRTRTVQVKVGEEKYVCGQKDLGNGYFEDKYCTRPIYKDKEETYSHDVYEDVPVYQTKYKYKLMEWTRSNENLLKAGSQSHDPSWPNPPNHWNSSEWREGPKEEFYFISVKEDDGDIHEEEVGLAFWSNHNEGEILKAKRSRLLDIYYGLSEPTMEH